MRLLLTLVTICLMFPLSSQAQTTSYTWINASIAFDYPAAWVIRDDTAQYNAISIATTEAMLDATEIPAGEAIFQVNTPISISPAALEVYGFTEEITIVDVFSILGVQSPVQVFTLDERDVARIEYTQGEQMAVFLLIEGDEVVYYVYGAFNAADQAQFEPLLLELAISIRPAELPTDGGSITTQNIPAQTPDGAIWQQQQAFSESDFEPYPNGFGRVTIAEDDTIYIASGRDAILELSPDGELVRIIRNEHIDIADLALDTDGSFWVIDQLQNKVYHLSPEGDILSGFGQIGNGPDQFGLISPMDIVLAPNDQLYLFITHVFSNGTYDEIQVWTKDGEFVESIFIQSRTDGFQDSSFLLLHGDDTLYAYAFSDMLVQRYDLSGELLETILQPTEPRAPTALAVDDAGRVFFATTGIIRVFENGERVLTFGEPAVTTTGEFSDGTLLAPRGMGFLSNGDLIIVDANETHWQITRVTAP